ncbi:putative beta-glucosidase H [Fusarium oxysporum f. sp. raphani]|uniref:beta-glucosidase n=1 Tax=Fusarium oxysporum f. sp. raphani TaxID=96318 RepID=A0A8J5Q4B7_FUSOX|nr:putative beta-glucosidase H [Fusarium oxysporum f. sp. raphani]
MGLFKAQAGRVYNLEIRFNNHHLVPGQVIPMRRGAIELGGRPVTEAEEMLQEAERAAREADVAIVAVGLNQDWECECYDRDSMKLPGKSDELEPPSSYHSSVISDVEIQPLKTTSSIANTPVAILSFMVQNGPEKELRDFIKVELGAGEKKTCSVQLTMEAFAYSDTSANNSTVDAGDYKVLLESTSRDIKESVNMFIETKASLLEYPKLK